MPENKNIAGNIIFDVDLSTKEKAYEFRDQFGEYAKKELLKIIDEVFNHASDSREVIRFDKIKVDLGTVPYDHFDSEVKYRLKNELSAALRNAVGEIRYRSVEGHKLLSKEAADTELIIYFLKYGTLPWWHKSERNEKLIISDLLENLLEKNINIMRDQIAREMRHKQVQDRLIRQFSKKILQKLVQSQVPSKASFINSLEEDMKFIFRESRTLKVSPSMLYQQIWEYITFLIFIKKDTFFTEEQFFENIMHHISKKIKVSFHQLLNDFQSVIQTYTQKNTHRFKSQLTSLVHELQKKHTIPTDDAKTEPIAKKIINLSKYTENELFVLIEKIKPAYADFISRYIESLIASIKTEVSLEGKTQEITKVVWEKVLHYLLLNQEKSFSKEDFLKETLRTITTHFKLGFLHSLASLKGKDDEIGKVIGEVSHQYQEFEIIFAFLAYGFIPWHDRLILKQHDFEEIIDILYQKDKKGFEKTLKQVFEKIEKEKWPLILIEQRVMKQFSAQVAQKILSVLYSDEKYVSRLNLKEETPTLPAIKQNVALLIFYLVKIAKGEDVPPFIHDATATLISHFYEKYPAESKAFTLSLQAEELENILQVSRPDEKEKIQELADVVTKESITEIKANVDSVIHYVTAFVRGEVLAAGVADSFPELLAHFIQAYPKEAKVVLRGLSDDELKKLTAKADAKTAQQITKIIREMEEAVQEALKKQLDAEEEKIVLPEEPVYINNAGLVLLNPYFVPFFDKLGLLLSKKAFKDKQASQRAAHILQYLATKEEETAEYELALNKIICGIHLSTPLEKAIILTEEEKSTCESLINGVIQNWKIIKKTSPDNLRVSFLQREGKLESLEEGWSLKVETRGYDVLLDKLPWSISVLKLPWMEQAVYVKWR